MRRKHQRLCDVGMLEHGELLPKYRRTEDGRCVVMKSLPLRSSSEIGVPIMTLRRISLLKEINHPNVASLVDLTYKKTEGRVFAELEHRDVDLRTFMRIDRVNSTDRRHIKNILRQILLGVNCYHSINVAHGSLNPSNVIINADTLQATITDLDLIIRPSYLAPEILHDSSTVVEIGPAADVFAIGCIFAEMLIGRPLFDAPTKYHEINAISDFVGKIECYPSDSEEDEEESKEKPPLKKNRKKDKKITASLKRRIPDFRPMGIDLLARMLRPNPRARITVEEALKHLYLKPGVQITAPAKD